MGQQICVQEKPNKKQNTKMAKKQQTNIYKWVEGVALLDIHMLKNKNSLDEILNTNNIIPYIYKSFNRIQTEKCLQVFSKVKEERMKIEKISINKDEYPYIVTFVMKVIVPQKFELFIESPQEDKYDIFDCYKKYGEINIIMGFWQGDSYEQNIKQQYQAPEVINSTQTQIKKNNLNTVITSEGSDEYSDQQSIDQQKFQQEQKKQEDQQQLQNSQYQSQTQDSELLKEHHKFDDISTNDEQTYNQFNPSHFSKPLCQSGLKSMSQEQSQLSIIKNFQKAQSSKPEKQRQSIKSLEISQEYFAQNYRKILKISEGCFGGVFLYFDKKKKKLLAVKILKNVENIYGDLEDNEEIDLERQYQEEEERVLRAIRRIDLSPQERFNDKQDECIKGINRNIVREILITQNRPQNSKINCLEGVVFIQSQRKFLLIFEYFGGCEYGQEKPTCDLFRYIDLNKEKIFQKMCKTDRQQFIYNIMDQIIEGVKNLYEQNNLLYTQQDKENFEKQRKNKLKNPQILIRDLNQANILIRRKYTEIPNKSDFEIMLIDFGMAKNCQKQPQLCNNSSNLLLLNQSQQLNTSGLRRKSESSDNSNPTQLRIGQQVSIAIQACHPGRSPKYLFDEFQPYNQKDDIFALSALFYTLHKQLEVKIEPQAQKFIEYISGMDIKSYDNYNYILSNYFSEQCFEKAKKIFENGLKTVLDQQKNVPFFDDMLEKFKLLKKQQCSQGKQSTSLN